MEHTTNHEIQTEARDADKSSDRNLDLFFLSVSPVGAYEAGHFGAPVSQMEGLAMYRIRVGPRSGSSSCLNALWRQLRYVYTCCRCAASTYEDLQ